MTQQEFETKILEYLGIDKPSNRKLKLKTTQDTVDLIKMLSAQGMSQADIAEGMWMDDSAVNRILNGKRHA